ncbi:MAG TPA: sigma-54 dependent transcriptional regulator [Candidatus Brocadiaceae bacterium]|nr:sigma-54 dependent transcriptional regulator [Candidatus Brocadiaceae bacterium]
MSSKGTILVVDDEETLRITIKEFLDEQGYEVVVAGTCEQALERINEFLPDLILLDLRLPDMNGLELLEKIKSKDAHALIIVMTGFGSVDSAVEAMKIGAYNYLEKPFKIDHLRLVVEKALGTQALRREVLTLRAQQVSYGDDPEGVIIGNNQQMKEIYTLIRQVAKSPSTTVLIQGESGTGKELVAKAIHRLSSRKNARFVDINCAALTESLLEAELFGYEKGSFTGAATTGKQGLFEVADKGTIFLDEIGEMGVSLQSKLLRILQERQFKRVGGLQDIKIDVRVIASTNRNLEEEVEAERFRKDLYFRLKVLPIYVPPLRERRDDIPLLVKHFVHKYNTEFKKNINHIPPETEKILVGYSWPGNIRELKNVIERAVLIAGKETLSPELVAPIELVKKSPGEIVVVHAVPVGDADDAGGTPAGGGEGGEKQDVRSLANIEKQYIQKVLKETSWRRTEAAKILGINRTTLYNKIRDYGLGPP